MNAALEKLKAKTEDLIPTVEVATALRTTPHNITRAINRGSIPGVRVLGRWFVRESDLDKLLKENGHDARPKK